MIGISRLGIPVVVSILCVLIVVMTSPAMAVVTTGQPQPQQSQGEIDVAASDLPGSGTSGDPYRISNVSELQAMEDDPGANYELVSDIDASNTAQWNNGKGFDPINRFEGSLDGNGHVIDQLFINQGGEPTGLVARLRFDGSISGVGLTGADITGDTDRVGGSDIGGLVGSNDGTISKSFTTGNIANAGGGVTNTGGLVGENSGNIVDSFSTADVSGNNQVGGLVGRMSGGEINRSFATGSSSASFETGGLVGEDKGGTVINSYWDTISSGQSSSDGGVGLSTSNMSGQTATTDMIGFDFKKTWATTSRYPILGIFSETDVSAITTPSVTFENQTVSNGSTTIAVDSAQFGNQSVLAEEFVVVVHKTTNNAYGSSIGAKIGESAVLSSGTHQNISVDLSRTLGSDGDTAALTQSQSLVAMLHRANTSSSEGTAHGESITRNGAPVTDRAQVTISDSGSGGDDPQQVDVDPGDLPGDGTESNPYEISNASELQAMEDDLDANYTLVSDIDASNTAKWNNESGFDPVGGGSFDDSTPPPFTGSLDGNNHTVTGLTISRSNESRIGLFGLSQGAVSNLSLADLDVTGSDTVGGLVGRNSGSIQNATASSSVNGNNRVGGLVGYNLNGNIQAVTASSSVNGSEKVGGLVGSNREKIQTATASGSVNGEFSVGGLVGSNIDGKIQNVTAFSNVTGSEGVGGLVGNNFNGKIQNATASGSVTGSSTVGGLVGTNREGIIQDTFAAGPVSNAVTGTGGLLGSDNFNRTGTVSDSYWDTQATGQTTSAGSATGIITAQMQGEAARSNMSGLEFGTVWQTQPDDYPTLIALQEQEGNEEGSDGSGNESQQVNVDPSDLPGDGSQSNPYEISNVSELQAMEDDLDENYVLVSDISASNTAQWNNGSGFDPIGTFTGSLDGNNQTITGLTIDRPDEGSIGLFAVNKGSISNLALTNLTVTGGNDVGGLIGVNQNGNVRYITVSAEIDAGVNAGGVIGVNDDGEIQNVTVSGTVRSSRFTAGGVVGLNTVNGKLQTATVTTDLIATGSGGDTEGNNVGGLAGINNGLIQNVTASGNVNGTDTAEGSQGVGGLIGYNDGTVRRVSSFSIVSGSDQVGGVVGDNTGTIQNATASGSVTGYGSSLGGFVGKNDDGKVQNAKTAVSVNSTSDVATNVGGFVGNNAESGTLTNVFAVGSVNGSFNVGGLVGFNSGVETEGEVTDSYFNTQTTRQSDSAGSAVGLTTAEMQGQAAETNMSGLAFGTAWQTQPNDYPMLIALQQSLGMDPSDPRPQPPAAVTFSNQTVPNGTTTVTVASAQFGNQSVPGEEFVVVVHDTTDSTYGSEVGAKIGESSVLSAGTQKNITVNLSSTVGTGDDIAELTNSQSLVAMLHRANTTATDDEITHGSQIAPNGATVTDRAQITVSPDEEGLLSVPFNASFETGLGGWTVNQRFRTADDFISRFGSPTRGSGGYSTQSNGSVKLRVDGGPSTIGVARNVSGLTAGTDISVTYDATASPPQPGKVAVAIYAPDGDDESETLVATTPGNVESGRQTITGTVTQDYPDGTEIRVVADVWPGEFTTYVTNISASQSNQTSSESSMQVNVSPSNLPGGGSESNPYKISNASELQSMEDDLDANYELVSNIDASNTAQWNNGSGFDPIGSQASEFSGLLDGNNQTITGLMIDRPTEDDVGLFAQSSGTLIHISLKDATLTGKDFTGGLVGFNSNSGTITNVTATVTVSGTNNVGGLVGSNDGGTIRRPTVSSTVTGSRRVGGVVGTNINAGTVQRATIDGNIDGSTNVGGVVGATAGTVENTTVSGIVNGSETVGGLAGVVTAQPPGTIQNVAAFSTVTGSSNVSGLVGRNGGTIQDAVVAGSVSGETDTGSRGVVAFNAGTVENAYWDEEATGQTTSAGSAIGLTTAQMQGQAARTNMSGLAFGTTWQIQSTDYPMLIPPEAETELSLNNLSVASQGTETEILAGTETNVSVDVTNVGEITENVTLSVNVESDTDTSAATLNRSVSVQNFFSGTTEQIVFDELNTSELPAREEPFNITVSASTANDSVTGNLTILAPGQADLQNLSIAGQGSEAEIVEGTDTNVSVDVTNIGDITDNFTLTADIANGTRIQQLSTTNLQADGTDEITFAELNISALSASNQPVTVTVSTANNSLTGNLTILEPAQPDLADLSIAGEGSEAEIVEDTDANVSVDVTNIGDAADNFTVTTEVGQLNQSLTTTNLQADDTESILFTELSLSTLSADTGPLTITVTASTAPASASASASASDSLSGNLTISSPPSPPASITFSDQIVSNGSSIVTVENATFGNQSVPAEEFVVVVHETNSEGGPGTKIGESPVLPGTQTNENITVNLSKQVADNDDVAKLTESQQLIAMLHRATQTDNEIPNHGVAITRNGAPVTDDAQITIGDRELLIQPPSQIDRGESFAVEVLNSSESGVAVSGVTVTINIDSDIENRTATTNASGIAVFEMPPAATTTTEVITLTASPDGLPAYATGDKLTLTGIRDPGDLILENLSVTPEELPRNSLGTVAGEITNTNQTTLNQTLTLTANKTGTLLTRTVTVPGDTTQQFSLTPTFSTIDTQTLSVNGQSAGTVTVTELTPPTPELGTPQLTLLSNETDTSTSVDLPAEINTTQTTDTNVTVPLTNSGDEPGEFTLKLTIANGDGDGDGDIPGTRTRTRALEVNTTQTQTVTFGEVTEGLSAQPTPYAVTVIATTTATPESSRNTSLTTNLTIAPSDADDDDDGDDDGSLQITDTRVPARVSDGEQFTVSTRIGNFGANVTTDELRFIIDTDRDGNFSDETDADALQTQTRTLPANETARVPFQATATTIQSDEQSQNLSFRLNTDADTVTGNLSVVSTEFTTAVSTGDPHIVSFDGVAYDFQAAGEFALARGSTPTANGTGSLIVQARQEPLAGSDSITRNTAVATVLDNTTVIIDATDSTPLQINGSAVALNRSETIAVGTGEITRTQNGNTLTITYPGPDDTAGIGDERLTVDLYENRVDITLSLDPDRDRPVEGVFGSADENITNDIGLPNGTTLAQPPQAEQLYGVFRESWRVNNSTSLFAYEDDNGPETYYDPTIPAEAVSLADLDQTTRQAAEQRAIDAGLQPGTVAFRNAVLDVALTDDGSYLTSAQQQNTTAETTTVVGAPTESIVRVEPASASVTPGETTELNLTLERAPEGLAGYNLTVSVAVDTSDEVSVADATAPGIFNSSVTETTIGSDNQTIEIRATDITTAVGSNATDISLGTVTMAADDTADVSEVPLTVSVSRIDDDSGSPIDVQTENGTVTVSEQPPLAEELNPPTDTDGDGVFEDVNGNGRLDFNDVVRLFENLPDAEVPFQDVNDNGRIDFDDIVELFKEI